ncbi:MAG TPA: PEP-CTERM sorting domain-containing protein [Tepidisphaeraceae bacterium]|jgi:hypothetical protein|nr:PEP-CTERM sorting domain-containing protein [Tepidisphaeraceae bacterium]
MLSNTFIAVLGSTMLIGATAGWSDAALLVRPVQSSYTAAANGSVSVVVELVETGGTTVVRDGGGLYSIGFGLTRTVGDAVVAAAARNMAFDRQNSGSTTVFPTLTYQLWAEQDDNFGDAGPGAGGSAVVALATLTVDAGATGGTFQLGDFGPSDQNVLYSGDGLDGSLSYGSFTVTATTAVPEPATFMTVTLGVATLMLRRRR